MSQSPKTPAGASHDQAYNRDQDQQPDAARPATEPAGAKGSARSEKTATDPASGEARDGPPAPNRSEIDVTGGAAARSR